MLLFSSIIMFICAGPDCTRAVTEARKKQYEENGIPTAPHFDGTDGGNVQAKPRVPLVKHKTCFNDRKVTVEQVPEGIDPAFNWNQGKAGNKIALQKPGNLNKTMNKWRCQQFSFKKITSQIGNMQAICV
jgi:hypothetical protein